MKIEAFDKSNLKVLRAKIDEALALVDIEGVDFHIGNMSYSDNEVKIQFKATTEGKAAETLEAAQNAARRIGITTFEKDGWKLIDYHPNKPKYPFIFISPDGKRIKTTPQGACQKLGGPIRERII